MRILIVSPAVPYPPNWGFGIRVFEILRLLARHHSVSLLAYTSGSRADQANVAAVAQVCDAVHTVVLTETPTAEKRAAQLRSMASRRSYQRTSHHSVEMQERLRDLSARAPYDVIQIESSSIAGFSFDPRSAVVVVEHDIVYELLYRMSRNDPSLMRRLYNRVEYAKVKRDEIALWRTVAGVVSTSPREAAIVRQLAPSTPVCVAPNAVDVEYFHPSAEPVDPDAIVMTGFFKTRPNIDGALYFVNAIFPRIRESRPSAVCYLVGGGPPEEITRLASDRVVVTGEVPDVRPFARKAAVFVVPLRMGGGTRLKVLEGLSMQKAMVSTSLGCEGIDVRSGEHLLIADGPEAFASAVLELLGDRERAERLGRAGRALVEQQYQWTAVAAHLGEFYEELLASRASHAKG